jgi:hypothetical protein
MLLDPLEEQLRRKPLPGTVWRKSAFVQRGCHHSATIRSNVLHGRKSISCANSVLPTFITDSSPPERQGNRAFKSAPGTIRQNPLCINDLFHLCPRRTSVAVIFLDEQSFKHIDTIKNPTKSGFSLANIRTSSLRSETMTGTDDRAAPG